MTIWGILNSTRFVDWVTGLKKIQSSAQLDLLTSQRAYRPGPFELKLWFILSQFILWSDDSVYIMIGVFVDI